MEGGRRGRQGRRQQDQAGTLLESKIQIQIQLQIQIQIQIFEDCNNYFVQGDLSEQIHLNQLPEEADDQPLVKYSLKQEMRI